MRGLCVLIEIDMPLVFVGRGGLLDRGQRLLMLRIEMVNVIVALDGGEVGGVLWVACLWDLQL